MSYNADSIKILEGLSAVRMRPGMYIGNTGLRGLHHLLNEIIDNAVDEYLAGYCNEIKVEINEDNSITVEDNGRGIPVDKHEKGISAVRIVLTTLHAGGKFNNNNYKTAGGLHGVGAAVVNALSDKFMVEIYRDGKEYKDEYINGGIPTVNLVNGMLPSVGKTNKTGTKIRYYPDEKIFETVEYKVDVIKKRLKELSYLNKGLKLSLKAKNEEIVYFSNDGIVGLLKEKNKEEERIIDKIIYIKDNKDGIEAEIAIDYVKNYNENIISFCNNIGTIEGGTHVTGFKTALTRTLNQFARELNYLKDKDENLDGRDIRIGIVAIISMRHPNPQYEGQTKTKLGNTDARNIMDEIVSNNLQLYFNKNNNVLKQILENSIKFYKLRKAEEKIKNNLLNKNIALTVNGKLAFCKSKDNKKTELFIVEGDSAGGSAKQSRNREFQAILPLKGKVLNVEKQNIHKILENVEITTLISTLGCGISEGLGHDFDIEKLKYNKIIILTDADVDGSHIKTLLLTFFYRFMPDLIHSEKIYIGMPPLYKIVNKKSIKYAYNEAELQKILKKLKNKPSVQRFKGLGEMSVEQLWETVLNPETRILKKVEIEDVMEADLITATLMGTNVSMRKELIYEEANNANIDI